MAPQLTVTKGLPARSPMPWMMRAISSLPTPVSPSISTGIVRLSRPCRQSVMTRVHGGAAGDDVAERRGCRRGWLRSVRIDGFQRLELHGVAQRNDQPLGRDRLDEEVDGALAHGRDHGFERGIGGLDDHRGGDPLARHRFHHRHAVEVGHHEIEDHGADAGIGAQLGERLLAAGRGDRLEAGAAGDLGGQPQLHRIVVDNQNARHVSPNRRRAVRDCRSRIALCRSGAGWFARVKRRLNTHCRV